MAPTPEKPQNAYDGAEQSAERQKQALVELLASQGNTGRQLIENRGQDAGAIAAAAKQQWGDAGLPVQMLYETSQRDAQQAAQSQQNEQGRIQAAHQAYMDQVAAGVPLLRQEGDNYIERSRLEYEDRQRAREAEEAARQEQLQMQRESHAASLAASRASAKTQQSLYDKMREQTDAEKRIAMEEAGNVPAAQRTLSTQQQLGIKGNKVDWNTAFKMVGVNDQTAKSLKSNPNLKGYQRMVNEMLLEAKQNDVSWNDVLMAAKAAATNPDALASYGITHSAGAQEDAWNSLIQPLLIMNGYEWGVDPREWVAGYRDPGATPAAGKTVSQSRMPTK